MHIADTGEFCHAMPTAINAGAEHMQASTPDNVQGRKKRRVRQKERKNERKAERIKKKDVKEKGPQGEGRGAQEDQIMCQCVVILEPHFSFHLLSQLVCTAVCNTIRHICCGFISTFRYLVLGVFCLVFGRLQNSR